jgi:hypothetical protein
MNSTDTNRNDPSLPPPSGGAGNSESAGTSDPVEASGTSGAEQPSSNGQAEGKSLLDEHKGKLAIGVAATLGVMIYYNWRQKNLPKEDPEGYAWLKRLKDSIKANDTDQKHTNNGKHRKSPEGK